MIGEQHQAVHIIGGGLAGAEAAWQLAARGVPAVLHEMRPLRTTAAHKTSALAELVCSNSFRSDDPEHNAVGLLHAEMRRLGSLIMRTADANQVPAGVAWLQSRYDKAGPGGSGADYINCPLTREQYQAFVDALIAGDKVAFHDWEATPYFDGCLPIEVMAERGRETLRHGPMKPFGLTNPHAPTVRPYAVVQLRQDNRLGTLFNMVGFQTKLKHGEQTRIFRTIPGLEHAEFARLGGIHRNTYLNSPKLLDDTLRLTAAPKLRFAGQI